MRTTKLLSLLALVFAIGFTACKKYEEGPALSLSSKKGRVANTWKIDKITFDGKDVELDDDDKAERVTLEKDGTGKVEGNGYSFDLEWEFNSDKTQIRYRTCEDGACDEWDDEDYQTIIKLKSKELWVESKWEENGEVHTTQTQYIEA